MRLDVALLLAFLMNACTDRRQAPSTNSPPPEAFSERTGLIPAGSTKLDIGEECTKFEGNDACESGLCLRVDASQPPKGFCSIPCTPDVDSCPDGPGTKWSCQQLWPSSKGWFCLPRKTWNSAKATRQGVKVPIPARAAEERIASDAGTP